MAVQTIILRPNGQTGGSNLNQFTRVPSDTADENLYLLFNEEVADDDATYICSNSSLGDIYLSFPLEQIASITPTDIRLVARMKSEGIIWRTDLTIKTTDESGVSVTSDTTLRNENLDVYETVSGSITNVESIKNLLSSATFMLSLAFDGTGKSGAAYLTQLYLEVDYDDGTEGGETETPTLYLKQSGAWEAVTGTVYNKVNGVWVEGDLSGLTEGDKIVVKEVTA